MTHEVLARVVDVARPDASRDDVGRLKWRLALLSKFVCCIHSCIYIHVCWIYMLLGAGGYPV